MLVQGNEGLTLKYVQMLHNYTMLSLFFIFFSLFILSWYLSQAQSFGIEYKLSFGKLEWVTTKSPNMHPLFILFFLVIFIAKFLIFRPFNILLSEFVES